MIEIEYNEVDNIMEARVGLCQTRRSYHSYLVASQKRNEDNP